MNKELRIFKCLRCGNVITVLDASGAPVSCCGEAMSELKANTSDGAAEKHVPVISLSGSSVNVSVGSAAHPMLPEHHISWILLQTAQGFQIKHLNPSEEPKATFAISEGDKPKAAYEYCNLHGLWKVDC